MFITMEYRYVRFFYINFDSSDTINTAIHTELYMHFMIAYKFRYLIFFNLSIN